MAETAIASDIHQALDLELNFRAQFPFHFKLILDDPGDVHHIIITPILNLDIFADGSLFEDVFGTAGADTIDILEANYPSFVSGEVNTCYPGHSLLILSALTLFEFWILLIDNIELTLPANDFAVG